MSKIETCSITGGIFKFEGEFFHCIDGPAISYPDGYEAWYKFGKLHRENGPAIIHENARRYYLDGQEVFTSNFEEFQSFVNIWRVGQVLGKSWDEIVYTYSRLQLI